MYCVWGTVEKKVRHNFLKYIFYRCQVYPYTQSWVEIDMLFSNLWHTSQTWSKSTYTKIPFIKRQNVANWYVSHYTKRKILTSCMEKKSIYTKTWLPSCWKTLFIACKHISINLSYHNFFQVTPKAMYFRQGRTTKEIHSPPNIETIDSKPSPGKSKILQLF